MTTEQRITALENAKEQIEEAVDLIRQTFRGTEQEELVRRTIVADLQMVCDHEHGWLGGRRTTLADLIQDLTETLHRKEDA